MTTIDFPTSGWIQAMDAFNISVSFIAICAVYWIVSITYDVYFGPLSKFPGPRFWALSRNPRILAGIRGDEGKTFSELHEKYGPVVRIGRRDLSFASGAQAWKDIYGFKRQGRAQPFKDRMFYGKPLTGVDNVIIADDANHSRQRKILSHSFSDKALKEQEPLLKRWASLMDKKLSEKVERGEWVDMLKYYNCTTFDIMGDLTFSEGLNMLEDSEYSPWVKTIFASIKMATFFRGLKLLSRVTNYLLEEFFFKSKRVRQKAWEHTRYTSDRVDRRLAREPEHPDLWTKILEKHEDEGGLSIDEHHSNASLFMIAGTETTATALSGVTYHLLQNPEHMKNLTKEVRGAFNDFDDITFETLARLEYLQAVLQEGLRIYPPVPILMPRLIPKEGTTICNEWIPGDCQVGVGHEQVPYVSKIHLSVRSHFETRADITSSTIQVPQLATYRMSSNFKNPYEFRPERWLGDPQYKDDHLDACEVEGVPA